jgi:hypothetical protein
VNSIRSLVLVVLLSLATGAWTSRPVPERDVRYDLALDVHALDSLPYIQANRRIFFLLRQKVLQTTDELERTVEIRRRWR